MLTQLLSLRCEVHIEAGLYFSDCGCQLNPARLEPGRRPTKEADREIRYFLARAPGSVDVMEAVAAELKAIDYRKKNVSQVSELPPVATS
jgi:hypothetical protein